MAKKTFIFYETIEEMLLELPDEDYIEFSKAVMKYGLHDIEPEFTGIKKALWTQIKFCIDNSKRFREKQSNNRKGTTKQNQIQPNTTKTDQIQPNVNVNVNENVNENLNLAENPPSDKKPLTERVPKNDIEQVEKAYLLNYNALYKQKLLQTEKPIINWGQSRKLTRSVIDSYGLEAVLLAIERSKDNDFCINKGYSLSTILSAGVLAGLINGGSRKSKSPLAEFENPVDLMDDVVF